MSRAWRPGVRILRPRVVWAAAVVVVRVSGTGLRALGREWSWIVAARGVGIRMIVPSARVRMRGFMMLRLRGGRGLLLGLEKCGWVDDGYTFFFFFLVDIDFWLCYYSLLSCLSFFFCSWLLKIHMSLMTYTLTRRITCCCFFFLSQIRSVGWLGERRRDRGLCASFANGNFTPMQYRTGGDGYTQGNARLFSFFDSFVPSWRLFVAMGLDGNEELFGSCLNWLSFSWIFYWFGFFSCVSVCGILVSLLILSLVHWWSGLGLGLLGWVYEIAWTVCMGFYDAFIPVVYRRLWMRVWWLWGIWYTVIMMNDW